MKKIISMMLFATIAISVNAQHVITLKSGEKMTGKVQSLKDGVISFEFKGNTMKFNVDEVSSVIFSEQQTVSANHAETKSSASEPKANDPGEKQITSGSYLVRYKVADRTIIRTPQVSNLTQDKGTVVVSISIDKYGTVIKAEPGAKGSTTANQYLYTKAKQAAESALFDNVPTAPLEQKGYMIISF